MNTTTEATVPVVKSERPRYETPKIQALSEREILNNFQITQSMTGWWVVPSC